MEQEALSYAPEELGRKTDVDADAFFALDLRAGRVVSVDDFPEARKPAWRISVDFGPSVRTLTSSAQITNYSREELLGRMVVGAINLGTKRIADSRASFSCSGLWSQTEPLDCWGWKTESSRGPRSPEP